ncbi:hypothetical protein WALSEDRAFT_32937, partial [Wallemia mellicola CBS 633.66]
MSSPQPPNTQQTQKGARDTARTFNKFAKRDPALYPLAGIIGGIVVVAGFFLTSKTDTTKAERKFANQTWADRLAQEKTNWKTELNTPPSK